MEREASAEPAAEEGAVFAAPPPAATGTGSLVLHGAWLGLGVRAVEAAGLALALAALAAVARAPVVSVGVAALWLGWLASLRAREPGRVWLRWDAWGITSEDSAGARVSLAWQRAWVHLERTASGLWIQIRDDEGRSISCASGRGGPPAPSWLQGRTAFAADLEPLARAVAQLPRSAYAVPEAGRPALLAPVALVLAAVALRLADRGRAPEVAACLALLVVAALTVPALADLVAYGRRAAALRGARTVRLRGLASELRAELAGESIPLTARELVPDARVGERGEEVRAVIEAQRAGAPYRGPNLARASVLETPGQRRGRRRALGSALGRLGLVLVPLAALSSWILTRPPPAHFDPGPVRPAPPVPQAWPIAPRLPSRPGHAGVEFHAGPAGASRAEPVRPGHTEPASLSHTEPGGASHTVPVAHVPLENPLGCGPEESPADCVARLQSRALGTGYAYRSRYSIGCTPDGTCRIQTLLLDPQGRPVFLCDEGQSDLECTVRFRAVHGPPPPDVLPLDPSGRPPPVPFPGYRISGTGDVLVVTSGPDRREISCSEQRALCDRIRQLFRP